MEIFRECYGTSQKFTYAPTAPPSPPLCLTEESEGRLLIPCVV